MYLFKDQDEVEIKYSCKICLKDIPFRVTKKEYMDTTKFPIKKESLHGDPEHKLIVYLNQYLEVENFEIKHTVKREEVSYSEELTRQVLSELDLTSKEIELYFRTTGREAVSVGEMALLINEPKDVCQKIAEKFIEKGLFKEIVGAQPHYSALPPYAALVSQLRKFRSYISEIKSSIPQQLNQSFAQLEGKAAPPKVAVKPEESSKLMKELKENMLTQIQSQKKEFDETLAVMDQIRGITKDISNLEGVTDEIVKSPQIGNLSSKFDEINKKTSQIIKDQVSELKNEFGNIKTTVSDNLQKLRLGVIQQTVDQVLDKIVNARLKDITDSINVQLSVNQMAFTDELKKASTGVNTEIVSKLKDSLKDALKNIDGLATKAEQDKEKIYSDIAENFNKAVRMAEEKIEGISGSAFEGLGDLKDTFSNQIVKTLDDTLDDILNRLETSEKVTKEFWDQARTGRGFTMKDIWFIRSTESAKAHINDEISKAKMRVLIVAPLITDIDINAIRNRPSHVNFRVATSFNLADPTHAAIINEFDNMDNVDYRQRGLQNLWGINKDYESVVVCVLSVTEIKGDTITEIAGIGSIIEEHIKIFVPILEEAWMSARKEVVHGIKQEVLQKGTAEMPKPQVPPKPQIEVPKPLEEEPAKKLEEPIPAQKPSPEAQSLLKKQFDLILDGLETLTGLEISKALEKFQNEYIKKLGYNSVLKSIHNVSTDLRSKTFVLSQSEREDIKLKMKFWVQKLGF
jgi:hypothetical protein